jgi:hypothetical protein
MEQTRRFPQQLHAYYPEAITSQLGAVGLAVPTASA